MKVLLRRPLFFWSSKRSHNSLEVSSFVVFLTVSLLKYSPPLLGGERRAPRDKRGGTSNSHQSLEIAFGGLTVCVGFFLLEPNVARRTHRRQTEKRRWSLKKNFAAKIFTRTLTAAQLLCDKAQRHHSHGYLLSRYITAVYTKAVVFSRVQPGAGHSLTVAPPGFLNTLKTQRAETNCTA